MVNFVQLNNTLSNINAILGSAEGALQDKRAGASTGESIMNFGLNVMTGGVRNQVELDMRQRYGTNLGFAINNMFGYGSTESNMQAMGSLLGASFTSAMFSNPFGFYGFGMPMFGTGMSMMYPTSPRPFWGSSNFSVFRQHGFYC